MIDINQLPNQQRDEKTVIFLRGHWIEVVQIFLYGLFLAGIPLLIVFLLRATGALFENAFWGAMIDVFLSIYLFVILIIMMTQFTDYYLDTWIVTTERIINIEQEGLFSRVVSELELNQVQDVTAETRGILQTMFTYGDVFVQTAGTRERFNFKGVDNPEIVKHQITKLVEEDKRRRGDASRVDIIEHVAT